MAKTKDTGLLYLALSCLQGRPMQAAFEALDVAMDSGLTLAVDVSHVFIQRHAGVIGEGAGTPVILESYFHRLSLDQRRAQVALLLS